MVVCLNSTLSSGVVYAVLSSGALAAWVTINEGQVNFWFVTLAFDIMYGHIYYRCQCGYS
jgi:hypothetical protein